MKIALINENSQAAKNGIIEAALKKVVEPMGHEVVNYGMYAADELAAISSGYAMLIDESSDVLQDLKNVVNVTGMSLSDAERLAIIDNAYRSLMNYRNLVRYYTGKTISVSYLRARKKNDMDRVMSLYGTANERYW